MFLGLPDPDPFVRGVDPDSSISKQKKKIVRKKTLILNYSFVTSFGLFFIYEKNVNVPSKSNKQKTFSTN
jgi:hypothetical protein